MGISVFALIVSGLSLWQSRKNSILQQEMSRPTLDISQQEFKLYHDLDDKPILVWNMHVKNVGRLTAVVTKLRLRVEAMGVPGGVDKFSSCVEDMSKKEQEITYDQGNRVPSGLELWFYPGIRLPESCAKAEGQAVAEVIFTYSDGVTNTQYSQSFYMKGGISKAGDADEFFRPQYSVH
jgi:hypothetical protein